jgi:hypothetical protein
LINPQDFSTRIRNVQPGASKADNFLIETTDTLTVEIKPNTFTKCGPKLSHTLTVNLEEPINTGIVNEYIFAFYANSDMANIVLPDNVVWGNDDELLIEGGYTYIVSIMDNVALYTKAYGNIYNMESPQLGYDPDCVILYTTDSGELSTDLNDYNICNANFISNTYENGQGILLYDAPITSINSSAFDDCISGLSTVVLPATVTSIGEDFGYGNSIDALYIKSITPPAWSRYICEQGSIGAIYVPMESVDTYKNTAPFNYGLYISKVNGYNFE